MRSLPIALSLVAAFGISCGLFDRATDRLDSSQAEDVCQASCDRQEECDAMFDGDACRSQCGASVAAWYLCPDAPEIADYIEMCNAEACEDVSACLEARPDC